MRKPLEATTWARLRGTLGEGPELPGHEVGWGVSDAAVVFLGAQLVSVAWAGVMVAAVLGGEIPDPIPVTSLVLLNIGLWIGYGLGPVAIARNKGRGPVADFIGGIRSPDVPFGLVAGVVLQIVVLPVLYLPILRFVDGDPSESARELIDGIDGPFEAALFALSVVVMAPLVEELFYRGLLLRALQRRFGTFPAILVSSLVFALVHRELLPLPGLFVFGLAAAVVTVRFGRLGPAWFMHAGFNLATLVVLALEA